MTPAPTPTMVTLDQGFLRDLNIVIALLGVILLLVLAILIMLRTKDPAKLSIMYILGTFVGKDAADPAMEHKYDGIEELDNPVPAWLKAILYGSIGFAVIYLIHYHFLKTGPTSRQEYEIEMADAAVRYKDTELPDNMVIQVTDAGRLANAASIFQENCATCHGDRLGGLSGPNLTDNYWLHGGSINEVYTTIRDGVPGKTMISWKARIPSQQRLELASYILSLQGTNPPGAKAPEGQPFGGSPDAPTASLPDASADSAALELKADPVAADPAK